MNRLRHPPMSSLELKIPPPVVALIAATLMWLVSGGIPALEAVGLLNLAIVILLAVAGAGCDILALLAFYRAKTTINPMKPGTTSAMVTGGIYGVTRNPMYVGLVLFLGAWAAYLWSWWPLLGPVAFVLYISRFQIAPEEKVLTEKFGQDYLRYRAKVRRWI